VLRKYIAKSNPNLLEILKLGIEAKKRKENML
jgi:hypothetical protein